MSIRSLLGRLFGSARREAPPPPSFSICYADRCEIAPKADLAIVSPAAEILGDRSRAFAYVSFTEVAHDDPALAGLPPSAIVRRNPRWNTWVADLHHPAWEAHLLSAVDAALGRGFRHLFLDTVDGIDLLVEESPRREGTILRRAAELFRAVAARVPGDLIMNRGFPLYPLVADRLFGVLIESYFFKPGESGYERRGRRDMEWLRERVARLRADGKAVLAVDYAPLSPEEAARFAAEARAEGVSWLAAREDLQ